MRHADRKRFLHPGEFGFGPAGSHFHTLLGSCVAITLWQPALRIGGMCHFVLPRRAGGNPSARPDGRYGNEAMTLFRRAVTAAGTSLRDYEAKIFGGGEMLGRKQRNPVGPRNVQAAMEYLISERISVRVAHVGESGWRRIVLDVSTGDVWVRHQLADGSRLGSMNGKS